MTEGQWIWMLVHMELDNEDKINGMCLRCKNELEKDKCNTCGTNIEDEHNTNPTFDESKFDKLKESKG